MTSGAYACRSTRLRFGGLILLGRVLPSPRSSTAQRKNALHDRESVPPRRRCRLAPVLVEEVAQLLGRELLERLEVREIVGEPGEHDLVRVERVLRPVGPAQRPQEPPHLPADGGCAVRLVLHRPLRLPHRCGEGESLGGEYDLGRIGAEPSCAGPGPFERCRAVCASRPTPTPPLRARAEVPSSAGFDRNLDPRSLERSAPRCSDRAAASTSVVPAVVASRDAAAARQSRSGAALRPVPRNTRGAEGHAAPSMQSGASHDRALVRRHGRPSAVTKQPHAK